MKGGRTGNIGGYLNFVLKASVTDTDHVKISVTTTKDGCSVHACSSTVDEIIRFVFPYVLTRLSIHTVQVEIVTANQYACPVLGFPPIGRTGDLVISFIIPDLITGFQIERVKHSI